MTLVFILLTSAAALELLLYIVRPVWRFHRQIAGLAMLVHAFALGALVTWQPNMFTVLFVCVGLYRLLNMVRVVEQRMQEHHLRHTTRRTAISLMAVQIVILVAWWAWSGWSGTSGTAWTVLAVTQLIVASTLLWSVSRNLTRMRWPVRTTNYTDSELPALTVAIPARNETEDLQLCLQSLIASDYPKLEIIVLDDCSQLKRTPEIIRDFAHDGVRFIQGTEPHESWLPKNQAYDRLVQEASGSYLLFCGVDVRFDAHALREMISLMLDRNKEMISVMPHRERSAYGHLSLVQAMRYWWELVPPRRLFNRPPVLSSVWLIKANALKRMGGLKAVARSIVPEAFFARELTKTDGYSFIRAAVTDGITSTKQVREQRDTAIRTRYPQLHRKPEQVMVTTMLEFVFLLLPFAVSVSGFWVSIGSVAHVSAIIASVLLVVTYQRVVLSTHVNSTVASFIGQPLMVLVDIVLMHYSMLRYEFSTVAWKGRNVCVPVMHVVPRLPKLD